MSVAFIVDGVLEKGVIQRNCPGQPVRMTNLNGRNVKLEALAERISSLIKLLKRRYFPVFVVVDREDRASTSIEIESQLFEYLRGYGHEDVIVACPDRMIENWIIAGCMDYRGKSLEFCTDDMVDGCNGKAKLKHALKEHKIFYGESTIGVEMCSGLNPALGIAKSESLSRFIPKIAPFCPRWRRALDNNE